MELSLNLACEFYILDYVTNCKSALVVYVYGKELNLVLTCSKAVSNAMAKCIVVV